MNKIIEDQIIQLESLGSNNLFLEDDKEANLNSNTELFDDINNDRPLFSKSDLFSEITFPTYIDKNQHKNYAETSKTFKENHNNCSFKNLDLTPDFFPKEISGKSLELKEVESVYIEDFFQFNSCDKIILDNNKDLSSEENDYPEIKKVLLSENEISFFKNEPFLKYKEKPNFNPIPKSSKNRKFFRVDDSKKHFKVAISKFATEELNLLIAKSDLPKKLKKKIHLPNYQMFTSNVKELDNLDFLSFQLKDIFTYGKKDSNLQADNEERISKILNYKKNSTKIEKIKEFLSLKYEDIIKLFYKSEAFEEFKEKELTKFFNDGMIKEKKISLLEENGLLNLFKMTKKKRKREFFFSKVMK